MLATHELSSCRSAWPRSAHVHNRHAHPGALLCALPTCAACLHGGPSPLPRPPARLQNEEDRYARDVKPALASRYVSDEAQRRHEAFKTYKAVLLVRRAGPGARLAARCGHSCCETAGQCSQRARALA
jgi:hypothetical protein